MTRRLVTYRNSLPGNATSAFRDGQPIGPIPGRESIPREIFGRRPTCETSPSSPYLGVEGSL